MTKRNETMMQYFEWYLPNDGLWWKRCAAKAENLKELGITKVWLPPAYKAVCQDDVGYAVYDMYDLGEFDQKGTVRTKYGTKAEYLRAIRAFHDNDIGVYADIVLNHRMAGDATEEVTAVTDAPEDRTTQIGDEQTIRARSIFTFPGRDGKYSRFTWNHNHFSGTDRDENSDDTGKIYRFTGKEWASEVDPEKGNFDYLMGMNVDMSNPEVVRETRKWLLWYIRTAGLDGLRLDAVKHISAPFYRELLSDVRERLGGGIPAVGEYWSGDVERLTRYLKTVDNGMSLFDVALHYNFFDVSQGRGSIGQVFRNTLVERAPGRAVTFVDNHDTQYGQSLQSYVEEWFKPLAYAMILLRREGLPCVFYSDYYGNPVKGLPMVPNLGKLIKLRSRYAYGEQADYMDDEHAVGWVRRGDSGHRNSGMAVLLTDGGAAARRMEMGERFIGETFYDALGNSPEPVTIDGEGFGEFKTEGRNVSVWVRQNAFEDLVVHE